MQTLSPLPQNSALSLNARSAGENSRSTQSLLTKPVLLFSGLPEEIEDTLTRLKQMAASGSPRARHRAFADARAALERVGESLGFIAPTRIPRPVECDNYIAASDGYISPDARNNSTYHIAFRRLKAPWADQLGIKPEDQRMVFYGLQEVLRDLLLDPITPQEVDEAESFYKIAHRGKPSHFNRALWDQVVRDYDGFLPLKIEALPEGAVSFPGEPVIQITAPPGMGHLAAWFESKLIQVWATSERATMLRYWLDYNKALVQQCSPSLLPDSALTNKAQMRLVDFSDRSSMTPQESQRLGLASLTSFPTTSTNSAGYLAWKRSNGDFPFNVSMDSLYHGVVQGYKHEKTAYRQLFDHSRGRAASYVADCYDFRRAVSSYLVPLAKEAAALNDGTLVYARPDSGDAYEEVKFVLDEAVKAGLYKDIVTHDGKKLKAMTTLRVVQADGMSFQKIQEIDRRLIEAGYSPAESVVYGVGGFLHDSLSRSNLSAAQKINAVGFEQRAVMKCPKDGAGKESIPGRVKLVRSLDKSPSVRQEDEPGENALITWYNGIDRQESGQGLIYQEDFGRVQRRVLEDFHRYPKPTQLHSEEIRTLVTALKDQYQTQAS
ncbi:MAG: nicotinamide phosphoribosyltransferase domain-containing protein [Cyanobacteria bacterium]|nr:nicotinamide phosphoribosyltransferase domain-containing protein [Cyanobacteriota bacterium]